MHRDQIVNETAAARGPKGERLCHAPSGAVAGRLDRAWSVLSRGRGWNGAWPLHKHVHVASRGDARLRVHVHMAGAGVYVRNVLVRVWTRARMDYTVRVLYCTWVCTYLRLAVHACMQYMYTVVYM